LCVNHYKGGQVAVNDDGCIQHNGQLPLFIL